MLPIKSMLPYSRCASTKLCVATLFEFLSLTVQVCSALENSFVIVDQTNAYLVTAHNSTKFFDEKHNISGSIHFLNARSYGKAFVAAYGRCDYHFVGYIHFKNSANSSSIGLIPVETLGGKYGICGIAPASAEGTFYGTEIFGEITFYDSANSNLTTISPRAGACTFNILLDDERRLLYYLQGSCFLTTKSDQLKIMDIVNNITKKVTLSEPVQKMEIDFTTNETFAISDSSDLMKGKIDSETMTLETFRKVNVKIKDITITPSELYLITNDSRSIMKMKRSGNDAPEQVFKSITFNSPECIAYIHYDTGGSGGKVPEKGFSSSISLHLAFYFVIILVNLELWNL